MRVVGDESDTQSDTQSDTTQLALRMMWTEEGMAPAPKRRRRRGVGAAVEMRGRMSIDAGHSLPLSLGGEVREGSCIG